MKSYYIKQIFLAVVVILLLNNCSTINHNEYISHNNTNSRPHFFKFLTDDLKGEDPRIKYMCMHPKFVNLEFEKDTSTILRQNYPNPCSPSMYRKFIMYIHDPKSYFQINILNNSDSAISTFIPKKLEKGYFAFYSERYLKFNNNNFETLKGNISMGIGYSVVFILDDRKYKFNLINFG